MKFKISKVKLQMFLSWVLLTVILVLAAFIRLYRLEDYMTFLGDEGRDALVVYGILHGKFTLLGPTASVGGFFHGPLYYYFMAPFVWLFNYSPVGAAVMVALFGIATVFLVYKIGSEFFSKTAGLIAAFLYTFAPVVVGYSRSSWNPNLMPFFTVVTMYTVYKAVLHQSWKLFFAVGVLLGVLLQLHYVAVFVGFIIGVYIVAAEFLSHKVHTLKEVVIPVMRNYIYILGGLLVGWSPFLAFEVRHGFLNIISIIKFIFTSGETGGNSNITETLNSVFFRLFGRLMTTYPPPEQVNAGVHGNIAIWYIFTLLLALVSTGIFIYQWYLHRKDTYDIQLRYLLIGLWFFLGIVIFGFYKKAIYDYYFGFMFVLPFLLVGNAIAFAFTIKRYARIWKGIAIATFAWLVWLNILGIPFRSEPNRQYQQVKRISEFVLEKTDGKPFNFALLTGGNSDHGYKYFFTLQNRQPVTLLNTQIDPERKSATGQLLIVCEKTCHPLGDSLWEVAGFGRAEIVDKWDVSVVEVYKLKHYIGK